MVKQWGFSITALSVLLIVTGWGQLSTVSDTTTIQPLVHALKIEEIRVSKWMLHVRTSEAQPLDKTAVHHVIDHFHLQPVDTGEYPVHSERLAERYGVRVDRNILLEMHVIKRSESPGEELFDILLNVNGEDESFVALERAYDDVSTLFRRLGFQSNVHVSVQGKIPEVLSERAQSQWIRQVMETLDATEVETLRDGKMTSISAFSPHLNTSIQSHGGRINIQIAVRSDDSTHQTFFTLGTPIITIEY